MVAECGRAHSVPDLHSRAGAQRSSFGRPRGRNLGRQKGAVGEISLMSIQSQHLTRPATSVLGVRCSHTRARQPGLSLGGEAGCMLWTMTDHERRVLNLIRTAFAGVV